MAKRSITTKRARDEAPPGSTIFRARPGSRFSHEDAEVIGPAILSLTEKRGDQVRPEEVVEAARSSASPLHRYFTWDDTEAAVQWRLTQARRVLKHIDIVYVGQAGQRTLAMPLTVSVRMDDGRRSYMTTSVALQEQSVREQIVERALREADAWRARYERFEELRIVFEAIEKARTQRKSRRRRAAAA